MVKQLKEDIEGIRYCVIMRSGSSRFYVLEQWCDSLQEAQDCARVLADLSSQDVDDDGESFDEYWAFDTKKWKAYLPADYYQDKYPFNYLFNPNIPIYRSDENGKAELLADYVGRKVNDYTGRWKKESYKKNMRENFELSDDELDLVYDIADRYCVSSPVSGNWDTETVHEMNAISDELGITPEEAKQVMIDYLGFEDDMFSESVKPVNEKYRDYGYREITDERDLYYLDNIDDICKEQLPAYSRSLMIAAHNDDYDGIQHWVKAIVELAHNLEALCEDMEGSAGVNNWNGIPD